ncbi:MAG: hypothetical protein AB1635_08040, partial [Acidobacteriota bacterium]
FALARIRCGRKIGPTPNFEPQKLKRQPTSRRRPDWAEVGCPNSGDVITPTKRRVVDAIEDVVGRQVRLDRTPAGATSAKS